MTALTNFTARLHYLAVVADEPDDAGDLEDPGDVEPQVKGINAGVTITAHIKYPPGAADVSVTSSRIQAATLTPDVAMLVLAPIRARIDNGQLKITADQADVRLVAQTVVLGLPVDAMLCYRFDFDHVTYGGGDQKLAGFAVAAPTADVVLDLATAPRVSL